MKLSHAPTCKFIPTGIVVYNAGVRYVLQPTKRISYHEFYAVTYPAESHERFHVVLAVPGEIEATFGRNPTYRVYRTEYAQGVAIINRYTLLRQFAEFNRAA